MISRVMVFCPPWNGPGDRPALGRPCAGRRSVAAGLVTAGLLFGLPAWASFEDGLGAYRRGAYDVALQEWIDDARDGNLPSVWLVGNMYLSGQGLSRPEPRIAAEYYAQAAEAGFTEAQVSLATLYRQGLGVKKDLQQAVAWLYQAAARRHPVAMVDLGDLFLDGVPGHLTSDPAAAVSWYRQAAELGVVLAQVKLGQLHLEGVGTARDPVAGLAWIIAAHDAHKAGREGVWSRRVMPFDAPITGAEAGTRFGDVIETLYETYRSTFPSGVVAAARDRALDGSLAQ